MRGARIIREGMSLKCRNEGNDVKKNLRQTIIKLRGAVVCRNNLINHVKWRWPRLILSHLSRRRRRA